MDNPPDSANKRSKASSPRYPFISLPAAIDRVRKVWDHEGKHAVRMNVLAKHWDFSEKSSGLRGVAAACGYYGLMEQMGMGSGEYKLTEAAIKILHGEEHERKEAIRTAALGPKLYREIWQKFEGKLPSDQNLESRLLIDFHMNREVIPAVLKDFRATLAFAGLDNPSDTA